MPAPFCRRPDRWAVARHGLTALLCATRGTTPTDVVRARPSAAQHDESVVRRVIQAALDEEVVRAYLSVTVPAKAAASLVLNIGAVAVSVAATSSDTFVVGRLGRHGSSRPARRSQFKMVSCASGLTGVPITPRYRQERPRVGIRAELEFQDAER